MKIADRSGKMWEVEDQPIDGALFYPTDNCIRRTHFSDTNGLGDTYSKIEASSGFILVDGRDEKNYFIDINNRVYNAYETDEYVELHDENFLCDVLINKSEKKC